MNKTVVKVFMVLGILVAIFLAWQLIFDDGGIIRTGYNAIATGVNKQWAKVAGDNSKLLPEWTSAVSSGDNEGGFNINID